MYNKAGPSDFSKISNLNQTLKDICCHYVKCPIEFQIIKIIDQYLQNHDLLFRILTIFLEKFLDRLFILSATPISKKNLMEILEKSIIFANDYNILKNNMILGTEQIDFINNMKKMLFASNKGFIKILKQKINDFSEDELTGSNIIRYLFEREPIIGLRMIGDKFWVISDMIIESEYEFQVLNFEYEFDEIINKLKIPEIRAHLIGQLYEKISGKVCSGIKLSYSGAIPIDRDFNIKFIENIINQIDNKKYNFENCNYRAICNMDSIESGEFDENIENTDNDAHESDIEFSIIHSQEYPIKITKTGLLMNIHTQNHDGLFFVGDKVKFNLIDYNPDIIIESIIKEIVIFPNTEKGNQFYLLICISNEFLSQFPKLYEIIIKSKLNDRKLRLWRD